MSDLHPRLQPSDVEVLPDPARRWLPVSEAQKAALDCPADILFLGGAVGSLKDLALTTPIPTPSGWTTMGEIAVGDVVFDERGKVCSVSGISPIFLGNKLYDVKFDDGTVIRAGEDHQWFTMTYKERMAALRHTDAWRAARRARRPRRGKGLSPWTVTRNEANRKVGDEIIVGSVRTTAEIAATLRHDVTKNHSIAVAGAIRLPERIDLPANPYVLGVWLGDGTADNGSLTIGREDQVDEIFQLRMCGCEITDRKDPITFNVVGLNGIIRRLGLRNNKHVPRAYLRGSIEQRMALLQGLMDTDGTANPTKGCVFYNANLRLMNEVRELLLSLGVKANISSWTARVNGKDCGLAYGISFVASFPVFRLARKLNNQVIPTRSTNGRRYIDSVTPVPTEPTRCITVDSPSSLYLCSETFIPTHNTSTMLVDLIQERSYPTMRSYFFRKTFPAMEDAMDQAHQLFPQTGAKYTGSGENSHTWTWPWGAQFKFRQLANQKDVDNNYGKSMSAQAYDEGTHWEEKVVRQMIIRNRSTDPNLKIRVRIGSNPGNVGHKWIQKLFMGGICPHCEPLKAPPQGVERWDGKWPSDNSRLEITLDNGHVEKLSIAYILSNVRDHSLYPASYLARVKMQSPATAKALLDGCWRIFEGQFFDVWEPDRGIASGIDRKQIDWEEMMALPPCTGPMVVPRRAVGEQFWWPRWVASDYGFSISSTTAHLFIHQPQSPQWPRGRVIVADEMECQETAKNFADLLIKRWVVGDDSMPIEQRWMPWYLSPDSFREIGIGFTLAAQMNDVLRNYGVQFQRADNDRTGGAMKLYTGLESGELIICEECTQLREAIESRIHDDKNENDVKKISGSPLDDHYDDVRYGYKSWETARGVTTPLNIRIAERLGKEFNADPTTAMHNAMKMVEQEKAKEQPAFYGGSARARIQQAERSRKRGL